MGQTEGEGDKQGAGYEEGRGQGEGEGGMVWRGEVRERRRQVGKYISEGGKHVRDLRGERASEGECGKRSERRGGGRDERGNRGDKGREDGRESGGLRKARQRGRIQECANEGAKRSKHG